MLNQNLLKYYVILILEIMKVNVKDPCEIIRLLSLLLLNT